jgi:hypothetical protein
VRALAQANALAVVRWQHQVQREPPTITGRGSLAAERDEKKGSHMRFKTKSVCVALIAVFAVSVTAVANASANEFLFSKAGTLSGASVTEQALTTADGKLECKAAISGSVSGTSSSTLTTTVQYEKCAAFGLDLKFSAAEYEYNTNGTVKILKEVTAKATACEIRIPAQTVTGFTYVNASGKLEIVANATHIISEGKDVACEYAKESRGTLTGKSLIELVGGTLEVS